MSEMLEAKSAAKGASAQIQRILAMLENYAELLQERGHNVKPYTERAVNKLLTLSGPELLRFTARLDYFSMVMMDVKTTGDDKHFLRKCAERLGLIFDKNAYDEINSGDVIEIYNTDLIQVFRNFEFFDVCSYTLLDLLSNEFYELYERGQLINQGLFNAITTLNSRPFNMAPVNLLDLPQHVLQEKFSTDQLRSMVQFKTMYPVYTWPQNFFGYMVIQQGEVLKELPREVLSFI